MRGQLLRPPDCCATPADWITVPQLTVSHDRLAFFPAGLSSNAGPLHSSLKIIASLTCHFIDIYQINDNKYGTVQELRSTFSHTKSINIDFSFV